MSADPLEFVDGIVHEPTQTEGRGLDLTLDIVSVVHQAGAVDFGGGELADAETTFVEPAKRDPDDDYGWWELDAGTYLLSHNETLDAAETDFRLEPHREVVARGASHPTVHVSALPPVPLTVGGAGIDLKENARVSTLGGE